MSSFPIIKLYKNIKNGLIYRDDDDIKTILNKYSEEDYILLFRMIHFVSKDKKMELKINGENSINAINLFSNIAQNIIKQKEEVYNKLLKKKESKISLDIFRKHIGVLKRDYISLDNFKGDFISLTIDNFMEYMGTIENRYLTLLANFAKATGGIVYDNLLKISNIEDSNINIKKLFEEISSQFIIDNPSIFNRSNEDYEIWRNRLIRDTLRNFNYVNTNKDIFCFILLHIFQLAKNKINIMNFEELDGIKWKKKKRKSKKKRSKSRKKKKFKS